VVCYVAKEAGGQQGINDTATSAIDYFEQAICWVYKSNMIVEGPHHASASIIKSQYVLSQFLGTIFHILNLHQGVFFLCIQVC
jgi:hypothetical protein